MPEDQNAPDPPPRDAGTHYGGAGSLRGGAGSLRGEAGSLRGEALRTDPRIAKAKALLNAAIAEHAPPPRVAPPDPAQNDTHQALIRRLTATRGGPPIWPYLSTGIGNGPYVELTDGSVKLDFIGGIGVHGGGHSHPDIVSAAVDAAIDDTVMQGNLQQHPPSITFAEKLIALASATGAPLDRGLIATSGAMANENALKIALHKRHPADRVLAFENAFAGRSLAMAALTDRGNYRSGLPITIDVDYLPFRDHAADDFGMTRTMRYLDRLLDRHADRYAAFWAEPIAGEGGYYAGGGVFFRTICDRLREANIPIIFDEVQSFGRTDRAFAFQHYGLDEFADIVTVGKITQACATLWGESFQPNAPILSQTFTGSTAAIAAGITMLDGLAADCFGDDGRNQRRHEYFTKRLSELAGRHPGRITGPFGVGMMIAFTPDDGSMDAAKSLLKRLYDAGLLAFICGGGGDRPARIRFLPPPLITTEAHIDTAVEILDGVLASDA